MLCSNCSNTIKPVVIVDIDGTLGDYHGHFIKFAMAYLGLREFKYNQYTGTGSFREWFKTWAQIDDHIWYDIKLAYRQGAQKRSMPVFPGASDLTKDIRMSDAELWLCTTRPFMRLDNVDPDTRFWLLNNTIGYDGLVYSESKYARMADRIDKERVIAILEDEGEQLIDAEAAFGSVVILRRNNYNTGVEHSVETSDLSDAAELILGRIWDWREAYNAA
jgi:hypothetical protein